MANVSIDGLGRGSRFMSRYIVERELGRGAFGAVYLCHDEVAGIDVAVKTVPPELAHNHHEMDKIRTNFQLIEKLHHPNIAAMKTLDRDPASGMFFVVMEYVPGSDLATLLLQHRNGLEADAILRIGRQMASALDFGHKHGILHRDIKPGNIRMTKSGDCKILDYGIANQIEESMSRVTMGNKPISGTGSYMSPEQWQGKAETAATDQYALASTIYECFANRPPFTGTDPKTLREVVLHAQPEKPAKLTAPQWSALSRGLDKDAAKRYPSCSALMDALEISFGKKPARSRVRAALELCAGIAILVGLVGYFYAANRNSGPRLASMAGTAALPSVLPGQEQKALQDALDLHAAGNLKGASDLLQALSESPVAQLAERLSRQLNQTERAERNESLRRLIDRIQSRTPTTGDAPATRPETVVACLGPAAKSGSTRESNTAMIMRFSLTTVLAEKENVIPVEREALEDILAEQDLSTSGLSDQEFQLRVGKLIPASRLIIGDLITMGTETTVLLRLVDTETSRVLKSAQASLPPEGNPLEIAKELVGTLMP